MSKQWYSSRELVGLPGLPGTVQSINAKAKREDWKSQPRSAIGGGNEYHVSSLPEKARTYLLRQATADIANSLQVTNTLPTPAEEQQQIAEFYDWQRDTWHARLYVLSFIEGMIVTSRGEAINGFVAMAHAGDLPSEAMQALNNANARKGKQRLINRATLYRWFNDRDKRGTVALAPRATKLKAMPAWLPQLLSIYQVPQKPSVAACIRDWPDHYPDLPVPNLRTAQRHIENLPIEVREWGRMGRNARRSIQPFVRRTTEGLWPMDIVTVDGHLFKAYVRHPNGRGKIRPECTAYLDIATRRAVGLSVWVAESQHAIWIGMSEMVLKPDIGIPAIHYSDNGAYRGERHRNTLARIGITPMFSEAYRAQARGVIERFNSSVWVPLAKSFDTYCGKDVDPEYIKKQLAIANGDGGNLMAWDDFVVKAREALDKYNNRAHSHLGNQSPNQAWQRALNEGWQPTPLDNDDLHDLLPSEERVVSRGEVSLPWGRYFSDDLRRWHGHTVRVAFNPMSGEHVWVSDDRGRLISIAERNGNARPYVHETMLDHARAQREQGRVTRLERKLDQVRLEEHAPFNLDYTPTPVSPELQAQVAAEIEAEESTVASITDERRLHAYWLRIETRIESGDPVDDEELRGYQIYRNTSGYQSMKEHFEDFGLTAEDFK